jgi:hypothetical protein
MRFLQHILYFKSKITRSLSAIRMLSLSVSQHILAKPLKAYKYKINKLILPLLIKSWVPVHLIAVGTSTSNSSLYQYI